MARSDRQQREFKRREEEILDAALALCASPDFESVTIAQIAEKAEVGKGTVYKHFASKDELLFRLNLRFYSGLLSELKTHLIVGSPVEQLRFVIIYALRYHLTHREYRYIVEYCDRINFKERAELAWRDDFQTLDRAYQTWSTPLIEAGMAAGVMAKQPVERVLVGLHACFNGAVSMLWANAAWCPASSDKEALILAVTDFMLAGLGAEQN